MIPEEILNVKIFFFSGKYDGLFNEMFSWMKVIKMKYWGGPHFHLRVEFHTNGTIIPIDNNLGKK